MNLYADGRCCTNQEGEQNPILHGEKDENAPTRQALLLRDRLTALNKNFEIKLFPDEGHGLDMQEVFTNSLDFFKRKLMAGVSQK